MEATNTAGPSPFKFLEAYDLDDHSFFFGREEESRKLYERLLETNLLLLYGPSGSGKTSLIQAGLAALYRSTDWLPVFIRREENLNDSLFNRLIEAFPKDKSLPADSKNNGNLPALIRQLYLAQFKPVYLILDQFEELFIQGTDTEAVAFFNHIGDLLESEVPCKVLLSMREEYLAHLSDFEYLLPELFDHRMRLERMGRQQLQAVITGTCRHFGVTLPDPAVADAIIDNLRDPRGEVELANLQIYLDKLYRNDEKRRKEEGNPTRPIRFDAALVEQTRQLEDVLSDFLEEQLNVLEQELAPRTGGRRGLPMDILFALVTDDGTKRLRTTAAIKEELSRRKSIDPGLIDDIIDRLSELRLIKILGTEKA